MTETSLTLLFHNLFLVPPVRVGAGRFKRTLFDPGAHEERRDEYAALLPGRYDIIATSEVFRDTDRDVLSAAWAAAPAPTSVAAGPSPTGPVSRLQQSSGLATFVSRFPVVRTHSERYRNVGRFRDGADRMATKGMLMVAVDLGDGRQLEIASTHLHAGGWTGGVPIPEGSAARIRAAQVTELNQFLHTHHERDATLLVAGDLNIDAGTPADDHLRAVMGTLGLADAWEISGNPGPGFTSDLGRYPHRFPDDPADPDFCIDSDPAGSPAGDDVQRIDRWFIPTDDSVRLTRLGRRSFPRNAGAPLRSEMATLSDHVGLHLEMELQ